MARKAGKLFAGNVFAFPLKKFQSIKKYETGVLKPTALRTIKKGRKVYSQYYHKPIEPGELD